ncbi:MAG: hypothetical protein Kilf2KO_01950 [Rhodospirillales bacterium]
MNDTTLDLMKELAVMRGMREPDGTWTQRSQKELVKLLADALVVERLAQEKADERLEARKGRASKKSATQIAFTPSP